MLPSACSMVCLSRTSSDPARPLSVVVPCVRSILPPPQGPFPPPALPGFSGTTGLSATLPAQPVPRGLSVDVSLATDRASHVAAFFLFPACQRHYPGGPKGVPPSLASPSGVGLPHFSAGSAPALPVSRPAQRSLAFRPAGSLNRSIAALSHQSASDHVVTSVIRPGCYQPERQLLDGFRTRYKKAPFHGALRKCRLAFLTATHAAGNGLPQRIHCGLPS